MSTSNGIACRLLCASESAYAISTTDQSGQYNPLEMKVDGRWVPDPSKAIYQAQYNNVGFVENPYIVVADQVEAVLVGRTNTELIIAFRGTLAPAESLDSFLDWLQDFWAAPISDPNIPTGMVHRGFMFAINQLDKNNALFEAIKNADPSFSLPIYITGHSKGGGMAPIAAMYLHSKYGSQIQQTITFAGPRPGNVDFCTAYNRAFPNDVRYENYLDIVPLLPPTPDFISLLEDLPLPASLKRLLQEGANWDYGSVGSLQYIDAEGKVAIIPTPMPLRIAEIAEKLIVNYRDVLNAHHASCGYGYMNGTCPISVCQ